MNPRVKPSENIHLTDGEVKYLMQQGLTPTAVEKAYRNQTVRDLARVAQVRPLTIKALALRWEIAT